MANTNTNTDAQILSTDIYEIAAFYDNIRKSNIPDVSETASIVGIFGYMQEMFSQTLQNTLIAVSETSNESIATKAQFSKNVIAHAINLGITDINASPAVMGLMIYLPVEYMNEVFDTIEYKTIKINGVETETPVSSNFVLDRLVPFRIGEFEYHLDYDVIIKKFTKTSPVDSLTTVTTYTAMYDIPDDVKWRNSYSDIVNPYINTVIQTTLDGVDYVAFSAALHQVNIDTIEQDMLTENPIENKTLTFEVNKDQLVSFDVEVEEDGNIIRLIPLYKGLVDYSYNAKEWCYYEYINETTIRLIFSRDSYIPSMNAIIRINVNTCKGSEGNFVYTNVFRCALRSDRYNDYDGMYAIVYPLNNGISSGGQDKKSIADLRKIIPKEATSRGAIINTQDLENYFNSINDPQCKLYFYKKKDNPFERLYYSYMLMKKNDIVYPTNTINLAITQSDFKGFAGNNNLVISPGTKFYYYKHANDEQAFATLEQPTVVDNTTYSYNLTSNEANDEVRIFEYMSPFLISIDDNLISSYLLTIMNDTKTFKFDSINQDAPVQFVTTYMNWERKYAYTDENGDSKIYDNKYTLTMDLVENNSSKLDSFVKSHKDANDNVIFDDVRIRVLMVLYADETDNHPYRYTEAILTNYDEQSKIYTFKFTLETDDYMDLDNRINIRNIYNAKSEEFQHSAALVNAHGYMNKNTYAKIYILSDFGTKSGDIIDNITITPSLEKTIIYGDDGIGGRAQLEKLIPTKKDITNLVLSNEAYLEKQGIRYNIVNIIQSNPDYMKVILDAKDYQDNEVGILRYLRDNRDSDFVNNTLLNDRMVNEIIDSYKCENFDRYTLCNSVTVDGGIDFYHDYTSMMSSSVSVAKVPLLDANGDPIYHSDSVQDEFGITHAVYTPVYKTNANNTLYYDYKLKRVPVIKYGFLDTETKMQDFIRDIELRRKYIEIAMDSLEDTFGIDVKFFNTYGPSRTFYYDIPSAKQFKVVVSTDTLNVYSSTMDEDDRSAIIGTLDKDDVVFITKTKGQWGYIESPYKGWIKTSSTVKYTNYIDNVALNMEFALKAVTSSDKNIDRNIIYDIKEYMEDINEVTELHIPNIITFITNNYREQLVYFEFLDVNEYGSSCQHLYLDEVAASELSLDIVPEFLNIETDNNEQPRISIIIH